MPEAPRNIISDISIHPDGEWYSGKSKIENKSILLFFKKNLHADVNGIFIYNEFGTKSEKAYIKVNGPILKVSRISDNHFEIDNGEILDIAGKEIAMDSQERLYIVLDSIKAWAVLTRQAMDDIRSRLTKKDDVYFWNKRPVRLINEFPWFFG